MNSVLWIDAGLLAAAFSVAGWTKLLQSRARLARAPGGGWALDFSAGFVKLLGALELLGAIGLILPPLLGIAPLLTPLAGLGLVAIMIGAANVEFRRGEFPHALVNLGYSSLGAFVAVGRLFVR